MTSGRLVFRGLAMLSALALIASLLGGRPQQLSLDVWLLLSALWLASIAYRALDTAAPLQAERLVGLWRWRRGEPEPIDIRPRSLVTIEGLLASARESDRANSLRLRPRLIELADHFLRSRHGIDPELEPERSAALLGGSAWLVARPGQHQPGQPLGRTPTLPEVDELMDILLGGDQAGPDA